MGLSRHIKRGKREAAAFIAIRCSELVIGSHCGLLLPTLRGLDLPGRGSFDVLREAFRAALLTHTCIVAVARVLIDEQRTQSIEHPLKRKGPARHDRQAPNLTW